MDATCTRCNRTYTLEPIGDRGFCCVCERDAKYEALYGPDWRRVVLKIEQGSKEAR